MYFGDGAKLASDYQTSVRNVQELAERDPDFTISRALGLGSNLLPYAYVIVVLAALLRRPGWVLAAALSIAPMVHELLQAGRRQYFVTAAAIALLSLYYLIPVRRRALMLLGCMSAILALSSFVFYRRTDYYVDVYAFEGMLSYLLIPALTEFVGVSLITVNAIGTVGSEHLDFGLRLMSGLLDSVLPYVRLGETVTDLMSDIAKPFDVLLVAPWGAMPILAEAYSSFGTIGSVVFGFTCGSACAVLHYSLLAVQSNRVSFQKSLWIVTVASLFLVKYRSGLLDVAKSVIALSYLHLFVMSLLWGTRMLLRSATTGVLSRAR
jgi:hypothetical protein